MAVNGAFVSLCINGWLAAINGVRCPLMQSVMNVHRCFTSIGGESSPVRCCAQQFFWKLFGENDGNWQFLCHWLSLTYKENAKIMQKNLDFWRFCIIFVPKFGGVCVWCNGRMCGLRICVFEEIVVPLRAFERWSERALFGKRYCDYVTQMALLY